MDKQQLIDSIKEIGTCEDDVKRRELLATLQENAIIDYDKLDEITAKNEQLTNDNESLMSANKKLFLMVGEHKEPQKDNPPPEEPKKYEDLFNEKGELK